MDLIYRDTFRDALRDAERIRATSKEAEIVLVRHWINDVDQDIEDHQWVYLKGGKLPECFDGGASIPQRFRKEVK